MQEQIPKIPKITKTLFEFIGVIIFIHKFLKKKLISQYLLQKSAKEFNSKGEKFKDLIKLEIFTVYEKELVYKCFEHLEKQILFE